jgi:hypothetical protein
MMNDDLVCFFDVSSSTWATGDLFKKADSDSSGETNVDDAGDDNNGTDDDDKVTDARTGILS